MNTIDPTMRILERTPHILYALLHNCSNEWSHVNEGEGTWSPYDIVGHLIHCDEDNWIPRIRIMLSDAAIRKFEPLDRLAQFEKSRGKTINQLIDDFMEIRLKSIIAFRSLAIKEAELAKTALHPELGTVTLSQLISTWAVHDLSHVSQITRVMAKQYKDETGPWIQYLRILNQ